eukprot:gene1723-2384_t
MLIDHVCVVCEDVRRSILWYENVLGLTHELRDDPDFGITPAFLRAPGSQMCAVALWPLEKGKRSVRDANAGRYPHNGAHFALRLTREDWDARRLQLPKLLHENLAHTSQKFGLRNRNLDHDSCLVTAHDYGLQLSLFFMDPDQNMIELTTWVARDETRRL